ncbi:hypothetical protein GS491_26130 [Rhodococcus hoagii]|nr:hypothetical protein [Prescottella equi]NKR80604.1 hypothetical protein [Prescottella equi]NKS99464.1 hypothetical protein [Prescottella equi]
MTEPDVSLWQALGISADDALDEVPDDVWASAVAHAVDPATPEANSSLVPEMDDSDPDPFDDSGDLAGLLHDDVATGHQDDTSVDDIDLSDGVDDHRYGGHHDDGVDDIDLDDTGL